MDNTRSATPESQATSICVPARPRCPACGGALGATLLGSPDRLCRLPGTFSVTRCKACGMGVTLPTVDASQLASLYPTTYGTYERLPTGVLGLVSKAVQRVQAWQSLHTAPFECLAELPAGRLLDVGCGRGDLGSWFVRRGWSVVGVEPSVHACELARSRGVDARAGTLAEVKLEPSTYDAVVFRQSLEHVTDPVGDLRRARQALRNGGVAIVSVPNFGCWQSNRFGGSWFHLDLPRHRFHFNANALRIVLERAGFRQVETCTSSSSVGLPASIQYALVGHCVFPDGLRLRVAAALCAATTPFTWLLDRLAGEGDVLHAVARTGT
ncbi:MAG: class I SAM-dependent methyltransferase [Solirubrobacteraceae bacterium]